MPVFERMKRIKILRCPVSKENLHWANQEVLERVQRRYPGIQEGIVNETGSCFYRVENGIPVLLADEVISLSDDRRNNVS